MYYEICYCCSHLQIKTSMPLSKLVTTTPDSNVLLHVYFSKWADYLSHVWTACLAKFQQVIVHIWKTTSDKLLLHISGECPVSVHDLHEATHALVPQVIYITKKSERLAASRYNHAVYSTIRMHPASLCCVLNYKLQLQKGSPIILSTTRLQRSVSRVQSGSPRLEKTRDTNGQTLITTWLGSLQRSTAAN